MMNGAGFLRVFLFAPLRIIPPFLHTHILLTALLNKIFLSFLKTYQIIPSPSFSHLTLHN
jgi:hypothetical protein